MGKEMLRGVYPEWNEWAQHDSAVPCGRPRTLNCLHLTFIGILRGFAVFLAFSIYIIT
jgi:hypothetical protein